MAYPEIMMDYTEGLLPNNVGRQTIHDTRMKTLELLSGHAEYVIQEFCKGHNICPICITGQYDCSGEH
jgi:hypothetical protein